MKWINFFYCTKLFSIAWNISPILIQRNILIPPILTPRISPSLLKNLSKYDCMLIHISSNISNSKGSATYLLLLNAYSDIYVYVTQISPLVTIQYIIVIFVTLGLHQSSKYFYFSLAHFWCIFYFIIFFGNKLKLWLQTLHMLLLNT